MALDIILIKVEKAKTDSWLFEDEPSEAFVKKFSTFKQTYQSDNEENGGVYYYSEISRQRRGVTMDFYEKIENDSYIVDKSEVVEIINFVLDELKDDYKNNFIDKFIEGQTCLNISW
jgi:hypothetical protein